MIGALGKVEIAAALGVAGIIAYVLYAAKKGGALPNANTFNPLSDQNLAYRGVNSVYQYVTGNTTDTIGTALASGYSDRIGELMTAPTLIRKPVEGLSFDELLANALPARLNVSDAGAAFPIYRKP